MINLWRKFLSKTSPETNKLDPDYCTLYQTNIGNWYFCDEMGDRYQVEVGRRYYLKSNRSSTHMLVCLTGELREFHPAQDYGVLHVEGQGVSSSVEFHFSDLRKFEEQS